MRRQTITASAILVLALVLTVLPAATGQVQVLAVPQTVGERLDIDLPAGAAAAAGAGTVVTEVTATPITFSMVGFELPEGVDELRVRTSVDGREWTSWTTTERLDEEDRPDEGTAEAAADRSQRFSEPVWVEEANHLQLEVPAGASGTVRAELVDSLGRSGAPVERRVVSTPTSSADAHLHPKVITRSEWGANESWAGTPSYASGVHMGVVHHTATSNSYSDPKAVMRSMYHYHTQSLGWKDLGYNIVVDQQGRVYEGRKGGLSRAVIGAHARGYNTGSFGISVIGNFDQKRPPQAAVDAVARVIGWKSAIHDIDPEGWTDKTNGSWTRTIVGHRDVGSTACPGQYFYPLLGEVRAGAAEVKAGSSAPEPEPYRAPVTSITSGPSGTVDRDQVTIEFSATGSVSYYECRLDDGPWYACSSPRTFTGLEDGDYEFFARAVDTAQVREDPPASRSWTVVRPSFSDIAGSVHAPGIEAVAAEGITQGFSDGTFRPGQTVTRGQMAAFLARGLNLPPGDASQFSDVAGSTHEAAIGSVASEGITQGFRDGTFRPRDTVTRGQMAAFLARALDLPPGDASQFSDVAGSTHEAAIGSVASAEITEGFRDGTFRPGDTVTRGQMATFIARALGLLD